MFGAPLAATTPFPSKYSPEERLLSESIMVAWTNFAKTGYVFCQSPQTRESESSRHVEIEV